MASIELLSVLSLVYRKGYMLDTGTKGKSWSQRQYGLRGLFLTLTGIERKVEKDKDRHT